jgi:putative transposase
LTPIACFGILCRVNTLAVRKRLDHRMHLRGRFGAIYFVTICCELRARNQLCDERLATELFRTALRYHENGRWILNTLLLMPDHIHLLAGVPPENNLSALVRDFKRFTARICGINWQRNYFDHRIRRDESLAEKADYISNNPVRAGLVKSADEWPFVLRLADAHGRAPPFDKRAVR